jgi:6-pyruvoyltetrahydropterin/6-carboxytetrahydropterin synthase
MFIVKDYKFYAAHRNEQLDDKCRHIHGHRYSIRCHFRVRRTGALSTLFSDFDRKVQPYINETYDHAMLINVNDPLCRSLQQHSARTAESFKLVPFDAPTTVENLAFRLFTDITGMGLPLFRLDVQETDTSTVLYTRRDWLADKAHQDLMKGVATVASMDSI